MFSYHFMGFSFLALPQPFLLAYLYSGTSGVVDGVVFIVIIFVYAPSCVYFERTNSPIIDDVIARIMRVKIFIYTRDLVVIVARKKKKKQANKGKGRLSVVRTTLFSQLDP